MHCNSKGKQCNVVVRESDIIQQQEKTMHNNNKRKWYISIRGSHVPQQLNNNKRK
jgi:hypothetical protein